MSQVAPEERVRPTPIAPEHKDLGPDAAEHDRALVR